MKTNVLNLDMKLNRMIFITLLHTFYTIFEVKKIIIYYICQY